MKKTLNLDITMLLGQLGSYVPMVENNATVDSFLIFPELFVAFDCVLSHACKLEPISQLVQEGIVLRHFLDNLGETVIILDHSETLHQTLVVLRSKVELSSLVPLESLSIIITQLVSHLVEGLVIA